MTYLGAGVAIAAGAVFRYNLELGVSVNTTSAQRRRVCVFAAAAVAARRRSHYIRLRRISVADLGFFRGGGLTLGTLLSLTFSFLTLPLLPLPSYPCPFPPVPSLPLSLP